MSEKDYSDDQPTQTPEQIARLFALAKELQVLEREEEDAALEYKRAAEKARFMREEEIPELMRDMGLDSFDLPGKRKLTLGTRVKASISQGDLEAAHAWLEAHGEAGMIKTEMTVGFNPEDQERARRMVSALARKFPTKFKSAIHPQTLSAWVRRRLEEGEEVPASIKYDDRDVAKIK